MTQQGMTEFQQGLLDVLNRFARVAEQLAGAMETGAGLVRKAGKKKADAMTTRGALTKFGGPNNFGFYDCTIAGKKYSTKRKEFAEVLSRAWTADAIVEVSFLLRNKPNPKDESKPFENRYIESVEIVSGTIVDDPAQRKKPEIPPDEPETSSGDEPPF